MVVDDLRVIIEAAERAKAEARTQPRSPEWELLGDMLHAILREARRADGHARRIAAPRLGLGG